LPIFCLLTGHMISASSLYGTSNAFSSCPGAELVARGMQGFDAGGLRLPSVVEQLRLPAFKHSGQKQYEWPRARR